MDDLLEWAEYLRYNNQKILHIRIGFSFNPLAKIF